MRGRRSACCAALSAVAGLAGCAERGFPAAGEADRSAASGVVEATFAPTAEPATTASVATTTTVTADVAEVETTVATAVESTAPSPPPSPGYVDAAQVGQPILGATTVGLTMFRGNATRTWYGQGPAPVNPQILWRYPDSGGMCSQSSVGGETTTWCGSGWTGQPSVVVQPDGGAEVVFGAYDTDVHWLDAGTGTETRAPFSTGDIIKGSVTVDPDGFPLVYTGSRDNAYRVLATDRTEPTELWALTADVVDGTWNNDWDGNGVVRDDYLFVGGENSWFFIVKLNRSYGGDGLVAVAPEIVFSMPGYTQELLAAVGDGNVSIESSVALYEDRVYFTNSGGRVAGVDISRLGRTGAEFPVVFDFWAGDDIDATPVVDADGMLYLNVELERFLDRADEVGQIVSLDPYATGDPIRWSVAVPPAAGSDGKGGGWATPALGDGVLYVPTMPGTFYAVDTTTGEVLWTRELGSHTWSSPAVVDSTLIVADCQGRIHAYDVTNPLLDPPDLWTFTLPSAGCIESTPAVWDGVLYVGSRDGGFYAIGDA